VVNIHLESDLKTAFAGVEGTKVNVYTITGADSKVTNMGGKEEVGLKESEWDAKKDGTFIFPKCSITMLRWKTS